MRTLTVAEVQKWWISHYLEKDRVQSDEHGFFYTHPEASCIALNYPAKLEQLSRFARYLATLTYDTDHFAGALLWFTEWGVWNSLDEGVGYRLIERLHVASGQAHSFEVAPGHQFRADELNDAVGMLIQPMIFGWDAFYLPRFSYGVEEFFLHVSHDSFVTVVIRTKQFFDQVFKTLEELNMSPKRMEGRGERWFCRDPLPDPSKPA